VAKYLTIEDKMVIIVCWANYARVHFRFSTCSAGHEENWLWPTREGPRHVCGNRRWM